MRALIVYCHPKPDSYTAAVRDLILARLSEHGAETRLIDLYKDGFDPILAASELDIYDNESQNTLAVAVFVYPTWWYGLPAMLKGWLDRTLVPGIAFLMPGGAHKNIRPGLTNIKRLGAFTTCGASWWLTLLVGAPGKRSLLRGVRFICAKNCKTVFAAHYLMDSSTPDSRAKHLAHVARKLDRFIGPLAQLKEVDA